MSVRKPHMGNAGYVTERKSKHPMLPGHIVIYDRDATPSPGIDADERWIVMHEPSSHHVAVRNRQNAQALMVAMAEGGDDVDLGQHEPASREMGQHGPDPSMELPSGDSSITTNRYY